MSSKFSMTSIPKITLLDLYYSLKLKEISTSTLSIESGELGNDSEILTFDLNTLDSELSMDLESIKLVETEASVKVNFKFSQSSAVVQFQNIKFDNLVISDYCNSNSRSDLLESFVHL